jgi:hypothetical protein
MKNIVKKQLLATIIMLLAVPYSQAGTPNIHSINIRNTSDNFKSITYTHKIFKGSPSLLTNPRFIACIAAATSIAILSIGALIWYKKHATQSAREQSLQNSSYNKPTMREKFLGCASIHRRSGRAILKNGHIIRS